MNEKKNEIMTKVEAPLGETTITLFRRPSDTNEGDLYFTAKEGAAALGLCSYRTFLELARDHRDEMIAGEEIVLPSRTIGGKGRDTKLFRISVLDLLGPLTKSEAGKKIRRWTADIRQRFRRGESAEIRREDFDALKASVASLLADLAARDASHRTELDARDRRIETLIDTQQTLAHAVKESASYGGRMLKIVQDAPEIAALDRAYQLRHAQAPAMFPDAPRGSVPTDPATDWLKENITRRLRAEAHPVRARGLVRHLSETFDLPRRFIRDAVGDLYVDGTLRREHGFVVVRPALHVVPKAGSAS